MARHLRSIGFWAMVLLAETLVAQNLIYLEHSETLKFDQERIADAQILNGNVIFRHENALMYCDSAYFYEKSNSLDAFGHVRFVQGDTLRGFGDKLFYDGNTKIARLKRNVRLEHGKRKQNPTILLTDSMTYDRNRNMAFYKTGGTIQDSLNTLTSIYGQYCPKTKQAAFRRDVHLVNDRFILDSDTLLYNTENKVADIVGPTTIVYEEETNIYSTKGWYNTQTEQSMLLERSLVEHTDGQSMTGDTIYYDKQIGYGRVLGNMEMRDTTHHATLYGNYGEMYEENNRGYATDSALMVDWSDEENFTYIHADTLFTQEIPYTRMMDSVEVDTTYRLVRAHFDVRIYRNDMQAICDSLRYQDRDSIMSLYELPVCWNDEMQISADTIHIYMKNDDVDHAHGIGNALAIRRVDEEHYDQMSGKEIKGYVRESELREVEVSGNALTIFFPKDSKDEFVGLNTTQSSYVRMFLEEQKVHHILFTAETTGTLYPMDKIPAGTDKLKGFFWAIQERPQKPGDVFDHPERTPRQ